MSVMKVMVLWVWRRVMMSVMMGMMMWKRR